MDLRHMMVVPLAISIVIGVILVLTKGITTYQFYRAKSRAPYEGKREPPTVPYWIPWVGSLLPFLLRQSLFLHEISKLAQNQPLLRVRLGPLKAYLVTGSQNVQAIFRKSKSLSFDIFLRQVMEVPTGIQREEIDLFFTPLKSDPKTYPLGLFRQIHHDHITVSTAVNQLTTKFLEVFSDIIDAEPQGQWREVSVYQSLRMRMSKASMTSLCGTRMFEVSPSIVDDYWAWDSVFTKLTYGFPRFAFPKAYEARDRVHESTKRWLKDAWERYDWSSPDVDWEENFGSRVMRAREKNFKETLGVSLNSRASSEIGMMIAFNGNAIPATGWALINLLQRPNVFEEVKNEVPQAANIDKDSGKLHLDVSALLALPWLLAVYTETLRLRVHFNVTREIMEDIEIDGHILKAGHIVMAPTYVAHTMDPSWATEKYPVKEFYPERFLIFDEKGTTPKFSVGGVGGKMFPYGGGTCLCPGRHLAKQEIMATIALMTLRFDFEVLGYVKMDGTRSDRGPRLDEAFAGSGVLPPDRDMRVRLRKKW